MKFTVQRDSFRKALLAVSKAINSKGVLPVLSNIHLQTIDDQTVAVAATNLELGIVYRMRATVEEAGAITVPSKVSVDLVNNLPNETIAIAVAEGSTSVQLKCAAFDNTLSGLSADDYPALPTQNTAEAISLPRHFINAINQVVVAAATDDSRPVLTAVRLTIYDQNAELVSADGFRLASTKLIIERAAFSPPIEVLIPAKTMTEVYSIMSSASDDEVKLYIDERSVAFKSSTVTIVSRVIEGKYPDVQRVIPTEFESRFVFEVEDMRRASKIAALMSSASGVKLNITNNHIALVSQGASVGSAHAEIGGIHHGIEHSINLNIRYLQDGLDAAQATGATQLSLNTSSATTPAILKPVGNDSYVHVIMPLMAR